MAVVIGGKDFSPRWSSEEVREMEHYLEMYRKYAVPNFQDPASLYDRHIVERNMMITESAKSLISHHMNNLVTKKYISSYEILDVNMCVSRMTVEIKTDISLPKGSVSYTCKKSTTLRNVDVRHNAATNTRTASSPQISQLVDDMMASIEDSVQKYRKLVEWAKDVKEEYEGEKD